MPVSESTDSVGGRVTRSLRKRLTSIDSDASSRPSTPVNSNLHAISETVTPSKRLTRRTSLSTPIATPSKVKGRLENAEVSGSPVRRPVRRRSVSTQDREPAVHSKSKEPTVNAVMEEENTEKTPVQSRRATRSISTDRMASHQSSPTTLAKSPTAENKTKESTKEKRISIEEHSLDGSQSESNSFRKSEKKQNRKSVDLMSEENDKWKQTPTIKGTERGSPRLKVMLLKKDLTPTTQQNLETVQATFKEPSVNIAMEERNTDKTPEVKIRRVTRSASKSPQEFRTLQDSSNVIDLDDSSDSLPKMQKIEKSMDGMAVEHTSPSTPSKKKPNLEKHLTPLKKKTIQNEGNKTNTMKSSPARSQVEANSSRKSENEQKQNRKSATFEENVATTVKVLSMSSHLQVNLENKGLIPSSPARIKPIEGSPQKKKSRPDKLKNVAFNETADEDTIKSVFPKTPGLIKSKSYILDSSEDIEKETLSESADNQKQAATEADRKSDKEELDEDDHEVLNAKTPYKLKLKAVESSTPIQTSSPKRNKSAQVEDSKEKSTKEIEKVDGLALFPKSWSQSVSGTVTETVKIDAIKSEESIRKELEKEEALKKTQRQGKNEHKSSSHISDDSDEDDVYDEELNVEEERSREKTIYVDDGEESMDSDVHAEYIGNEGSEGEPDEEVNPVALSVSEGEVNEKPKGKNYKRIIRRSESFKDVDTSTQTKEKELSLAVEKELGRSTKSNSPNPQNEQMGIDSSIEENHNENDKTSSKENPKDHEALNAVESSTSNQTESLKRNTISEVEDPKKTSTKQDERTDGVTLFPKSWSHSVSGTVKETAKIDIIKSEESSMRKQLEEEAALKKTRMQNQSKQKSRKHIIEDSDEDDCIEEDEDYDEDLEEEEERNVEKSMFIDDEAMEVAEGEESMDSEERAYIEENEIPVHGESIGSEDSEDEDYEDEADEEDDAFIVSDSEDPMHPIAESDSEEEITDKPKEKNYKRILRHSESSNEGDQSAQVKEKDFCLALESSIEEDQGNDAKLNSPKREQPQKNQLRIDSSVEEEHITVNKFNTPKKGTPGKNNENSSTAKERTPEKRKTPKKKQDSEDEVDKLVSAGETPNKRKSLKNVEEGKETTFDESREEQSKSLIEAEMPTEGNIDSEIETEEGLSKKQRKSLCRNKRDSIVQEDALDVDIEAEIKVIATDSPKKSRKSANKTKGETSQSDVNLENTLQGEKALESPKKASLSEENHESKNTAKSPKRKSLNKSMPDNEAADEDKANTSKKESRKSLNSHIAESPKKDHNISKRDSRKSLIKSNVESDHDDNEEIIPEDKNTQLKTKRKSLNKSIENAVKNISEEEEEGSSEKKTLNVSRKSLNESKNVNRKSMIRSSTEEANKDDEQKSIQSRSLNRSKLEKSVLSFEDSFEPEETLSASEVPSETSGGKSLNSSRRSRKSLNRSKPSLENDEEASISKEKILVNEEPEEEVEFKKPPRRSLNKNILLRVDSGSEEECSKTAQEDGNDDDEGEDEAFFSDAEVVDHHKHAAERSTMSEFLGEEEDEDNHQQRSESNLNSSRRSSVNKSKLDETFEMESKSNSVSMHDNLHRSIMRKSLNQSQLRRAAIEKNKNDSASEKDDDSDDLADSSQEEGVTVIKKSLPERGLSVSLTNVDFKKKKLKGEEKAIRNSFTIGVSIRKNPQPENTPTSSASNSDVEQSLSEQEDLENVKNVKQVRLCKSRHSLSTSLKTAPPNTNTDDIKEQKRIRRTSLYMQEKAASQSFVENITEEKNKMKSKKKRHSNSFCGVVAPSKENKIEEEPKSEKKLNPSSESENKTDIQHILSRCDEILEAANRAKREAKLNANKSKVKKPKWMDKEANAAKADDEVKIPLVGRKELKRKEKIKKELAKAIKHSTAMLKTIDPKLAKKLKATPVIEAEHTDNSSILTKRLPTAFLETLDDAPPEPKKKKSKANDISPQGTSDKENSKKNSNKLGYVVTDISDENKKKKKHDRQILETVTGTVIVEPSTPVKQRIQHGFRETPRTPAGFNIQDIHSAGRNGKDKSQKRGKKLFTASGEFIEEDLSKPGVKSNTKGDKINKRKRNFEEPSYCLPKTQWTPSGVFVEEDLYARPLANSTATQFMVTSLNGNKKLKNPSKVVSSTTLNSALEFKQSSMFSNKAQRETSRDVIYRKQRKLANNQY